MNQANFQQEVVGTVRRPDGQLSARIDGLVLRSLSPSQGHPIIDLPTAIVRANAGLLWTQLPNGGRRVRVIAVDADGDGVFDYVKTEADSVHGNNLLALPIWDRVRQRWVEASNGLPRVSP